MRILKKRSLAVSQEFLSKHVLKSLDGNWLSFITPYYSGKSAMAARPARKETAVGPVFPSTSTQTNPTGKSNLIFSAIETLLIGARATGSMSAFA